VLLTDVLSKYGLFGFFSGLWLQKTSLLLWEFNSCCLEYSVSKKS